MIFVETVTVEIRCPGSQQGQHDGTAGQGAPRSVPQGRVSLSGCAASGRPLMLLSLRFPNQSKSCRLLPLGVYDSARLQSFGRALLPSSELGNKPTSLPSSPSRPHPCAAPKLPPSPAVSTSHRLPRFGFSAEFALPRQEGLLRDTQGPWARRLGPTLQARGGGLIHPLGNGCLLLLSQAGEPGDKRKPQGKAGSRPPAVFWPLFPPHRPCPLLSTLEPSRRGRSRGPGTRPPLHTPPQRRVGSGPGSA